MLLNPTRYLGNLLLAGGLIQHFAEQCRRQDREFLVVLDAAFRGLCAEALSGIKVLWYPRQAIKRAGALQKLRLFAGFLGQLREFHADLAFNIEEDGLASRLTQLSGARFRLGCSPTRHRFGYEHVLPLRYGLRHRWYDYHAVFAAVGLSGPYSPGYMNLVINPAVDELIQKLPELLLTPDTRLIALHPAATKDYKKWPETAFIELCNLLIRKGFSPVLLGAGPDDWQRCDRIQRLVSSVSLARPINLCDRLGLAELAGFLRLCKGIVGNDSGPSHLASAQRVPGVVIFGPSDPAIWGPLGARSRVVRKGDLCDPRCSRRSCYADYRCLHEIRPEEVFEVLAAQMRAGESA